MNFQRSQPRSVPSAGKDAAPWSTASPRQSPRLLQLPQRPRRAAPLRPPPSLQPHVLRVGLLKPDLAKAWSFFSSFIKKKKKKLNEALVKGNGSDTAAAVINVVQG